MARIIVTADRTAGGATPGATSILLDESVSSVHLSDDHAAMQLIERLGWAISDAEDAERAQPRRHPPRRRESRVARGAHRLARA